MIPSTRLSPSRAAAALLVLLTLLMLWSGPAGATPQPRNGPLAFAKQSRVPWDDSTDIVLQLAGAPNGLAYVYLTTDHGYDGQASWSPDGRRVAFVRYTWDFQGLYTRTELHLVNADGSGLTRLIYNDLNESAPLWSPDGTRLVFTAAPGDPAQDRELYSLSVGADGSAGAPLRLTADDANNWAAAWSPDGTRLAFTSGDTDNAEIDVLSLRDGRRTRLTHNTFFDGRPAWSPDGTKIVFDSGRDGNLELYIMNADGSGQTRLTNNAAPDAYPIWSPNGQFIAYLSGDHVMVMQPNGAGQHAIASSSTETFMPPSWSPDSTRVAFAGQWCLVFSRIMPPPCEYALHVAAADGSGHSPLIPLSTTGVYDPVWSPVDGRIAYSTGNRIATMDAAGGAPVALTNKVAIRNGDPAWSPDGGRLAFSSNANGNSDVHVMYTDQGRGRRALTTHPANDWNPAWSPYGGRILFTSNRDGNWELYRMNTDGSGQINLTHTAADEDDAAWSPDGTKIAFAGQERGNWDIYLMNADGSGVTPLTTHAADDTYPTWSPDGTRIAFMTNRDGNSEIYVLDLLGPPGNETNLTRHSAHDREPAWSPDGTLIAFSRSYVDPVDPMHSLYQMNADGSEQTVLYREAERSQPAWQPQVEPGPVRNWIRMIGR